MFQSQIWGSKSRSDPGPDQLSQCTNNMIFLNTIKSKYCLILISWVGEGINIPILGEFIWSWTCNSLNFNLKNINSIHHKKEKCHFRILLLTDSCIYWIRNGDALKLSIAESKNPWLSFECMSTVMMWLKPAFPSIWAINFKLILDLLLILAKKRRVF